MAARESREAWKAKTRSLWAAGGAGGRGSGTAASRVVGGVWIVVSLPSLDTRSRGEVRGDVCPFCVVVAVTGDAVAAEGAGVGAVAGDRAVLAGGENGRGISNGGRGGGGRGPCTSGW